VEFVRDLPCPEDKKSRHENHALITKVNLREKTGFLRHKANAPAVRQVAGQRARAKTARPSTQEY
jgi:hypothetical protein